MQAESEHNFVQRLERLRAANFWTWLQVAQAIGLSRAMLHLVRTGKYEPSAMVIHALSIAEVEAGLRVMTIEEEELQVKLIRAKIKEALSGAATRQEAIQYLSMLIAIAANEIIEVSKWPDEKRKV